MQSLALWSQLFQASPLLWMLVVFVLSLLVGSFLNVVIYRLPLMMQRDDRAVAKEILAEPEPATPPGTGKHFNLMVPRSACPKCQAPITAAQNIPVVSWLMLGGKCANCRAPISARYPLIELTAAIVSAAVAWRFGYSWHTGAALIFTWTLLALSVIDFDHKLLPDSMTLSLMWLGLLLSLTPDHARAFPVDPRSSILGAVIGYLSLWSIYHLFKLVTGKEGMGYGDFKLFAAFGAWMGWKMLLMIILLSSFTGAVVGIGLILFLGRDRHIPIPFGPYLAAAGWLALMWGPELTELYLRVSGLGH